MNEEKIICPHCGSGNIFSQGNKYLCGDCRQGFVMQEEFQPLNLFISYGHPEDDICTRIRNALTTRGHKVWFDQTHINSGDNWRQKIADGIANSNGVIACLSKHSVRNPGVCLDELSIAVGVRGGNIKTILLETESEVQPPASVCHIQWLDMHDWKEKFTQGSDIFQPWFDGKMQELFQIVESKESRAFAGQITYIREKLPACMQHDVSKQSYLLGQLFVGREWLTEEIEQWMNDPNANRLAILYGDAGVGKSAFAAQYIHRNARVAAGIFCEYDRENFNRPESVIQTLAYLLACRLPDYRVILVGILSDMENIGSLNASELFDLLMANPLSTMSIDGGHETMCIVIDGLDECGQAEYNVLADTLSRYVPRLPKWLRVLVTAREVASVRGSLEQAHRIELHGENRDNLDDIRAYFVHRLEKRFGQEDSWKKALDTLTERSGGIFLYAELISDGILKGNLSISDPDSFPEGLSAAFHRWFGWICPNDEDGEKYKKTLRRPLGAILAAPRPIPTEELKRLFDWDDNELHDFILRTEVLLRRGTDAFGKETLEFSHKYISDWLTDAKDSGRYYSSRQAATEHMAKCFYGQFQQGADTMTEFEALYLTMLLEACGRERGAELEAAYDIVVQDNVLFWKIIDAGDYCRDWGKMTKAMECYCHAQHDVEIAVSRKETLHSRRNLSVSYNKIAGLREKQGDLAGAQELYEKGLTIAEQLAEERGTPEDLRDLSVSYNRIGELREQQGDLAGAQELYEKDLAIAEQLAEERGTPEDLRDLSVSYNQIAGLREKQSDLAGAQELYEKSLVIREQLAEERGTPEDLRDLSVSYENVARLREQQGDLAGAQELYEKGLAIAQQLAEERGTPEDLRDLSVSYNKIAGLREKQGDLAGAQELYEKDLEIAEQLAEERGTPEDLRDLSVSYNKIAGLREKQGDLAGAQELYEKSLRIREQLVKERGTPEDLRDLSVSYERIAGLREKQGDLAGAQELYEKSLRIREQLVKERGTIQDYDDLVVSYLNLAKCSTVSQERQLKLAKRSASIARQLYETTQMWRHKNLFDLAKRLVHSLS